MWAGGGGGGGGGTEDFWGGGGVEFWNVLHPFPPEFWILVEFFKDFAIFFRNINAYTRSWHCIRGERGDFYGSGGGGEFWIALPPPPPRILNHGWEGGGGGAEFLISFRSSPSPHF